MLCGVAILPTVEGVLFESGNRRAIGLSLSAPWRAAFLLNREYTLNAEGIEKGISSLIIAIPHNTKKVLLGSLFTAKRRKRKINITALSLRVLKISLKNTKVTELL